MFSWLNSCVAKTPTRTAAAEKGPLQLRIEEVAERLGWSQADFVKFSGASRSMVGQWFGQVAAGRKPIREIQDVEVAMNLAEHSGYSAVWLAKGVLPKKLPGVGDSDPQAAELLRIHGTLDQVGKARLLAFAADLSGKRRIANG